MKGRIDKLNVLYESWQMQCCGDPVEVGRATTLTIDTKAKITDLAGCHIDFHEEHHGDANHKIRGLVVGIKAVFVDKLAYEGAYYDNPNNTFSVYDATFIDGFQDKVQEALDKYEPYFVARYAVALAEAFNRFYHEDAILSADEKTRDARLVLTRTAAGVLKEALYLVGVSAPEKM